MIEILKTYFLEIAIVVLTLYLLMKVKKTMKKIIGFIFALAAIARCILLFIPMN